MNKKILKSLYHGNVNEMAKSTQEFMDTPEFHEQQRLFHDFENTLSKEQKKLFSAYSDADNDYLNLEIERIYENGVKLGFWLAMEIIDFDPRSL